MKNVKVSFLFSFAVVLLVSAGCKTQQKAEKTDIKKKNSTYLLKKLKENELNYKWFNARASTNAEIGDQKLQMTLKIRIRKDSAIWLSISPALGIEMARVLITNDSLKFLNRLEKNFMSGPISYLDNFAPVSINYKMFQALITGNTIISKEDQESTKPEKYKVQIDDGKHLMSTLKMKKYIKTAKGKKTVDAAVNRIWLLPKSFKIAKSEINNFNSNKRILASYDQFEEVEKQLIAHLVEVVMQADQRVSVTLGFSKVALNRPLKMPFRIPSKYEPIQQ
ncbi:MAG: DUF4292 domain-containing protein [Flavobacteriales bacterium]|nr:DUF4292 domain-containing protein [Flavobacteriales bacterium]